MRPTFMGFETAKKAIFVNQKSIDIMGNNLANVQTPGYTRQRVDRTAVASYSSSSRIASSRIGLIGQGVDAAGVSQTRDTFLDKRFREEYGKASYHGQAASILDDLQTAIGDGKDITDESGIYGAIKQIYESLNDFISEPTSSTQSNLVMSAFKNITQVLQQVDSGLTKMASRQTEDLILSVERVNDLAAQIAHVNKMIGEDATVLTEPGNEYFRPNELMDQRNLLLDELASYGNISVKELSNGKINVSFGGHEIVTENSSDSLVPYPNTDNTVSVKWGSSGESVKLDSGALLASLHFINGRGNNVQSSTEEPYQGIPYYRDQMDTFASALANMANTTLPELDEATGKPRVDASGNIVYKKLLGSKNTDGTFSDAPITAGNISISEEWTEAGSEYFIFNKNEKVEDYAQQLAANLTEFKFTFDSYGEKYEGTFSDYIVNMTSKLGSDVAFHEGRNESFSKASNDFLDRRDEISGVSEDEETSDMLKYQKSYEAAARLMTVLDDLLDVIINQMGI